MLKQFFVFILVTLSLCQDRLFLQAEKFAKLDINKDGVITMSDVENAFKGEISYDEADKFFEIFDLNHDGMITLPEYINNLKPAKKIDWLYNHLDYIPVQLPFMHLQNRMMLLYQTELNKLNGGE